MSRLTIDLTEQQHQSIKAMAALQGKSIKEYAIERLFVNAADDELAMSELRQLLEQRLAAASGGAVSAKGMAAVAEEVITSRGAA